MQITTRKSLVKVNLDSLRDYKHNNFSSFGAEPKICTGYPDSYGNVAIPLKFLLRDGFSFHFPDEWYEKGSLIVNNEPCYIFDSREVDVLTEA